MSPRLIVHLDMNSYFASVEQQANPALRGRAVGVCAYLHRFGCVIAASVEAKRCGIKVGMTMARAQEVVPDAVFVQNDPAKYRAVTSKLFELLDEVSDRVEHYSIDEAFIDCTGWCRDEAEVAFVCSRLKHRIQTEIGEWLRCSIGIAPTRFLAKFASDRQKPNGLVIINTSNLDEFLSRAQLEDACGIGRRLRKRLEALGILTLLDLKRYPVSNLLRVFGKQGFYFWCRMNAIECEQVQQGSPLPKSVGHSYCVPNSVNREKKVAAVLTKLTERAGRRMRALDLCAGSIVVVIGFRSAHESAVHHLRFDELTDDSFTLVEYAQRCLRVLWKGESVDFLAVTLVELGQRSPQLSLVSDERSMDMRRRYLSRSMDLIRHRYGEPAIILGRMFSLMGAYQDHAPDRIGFRKVEGIDVQDRMRSVTYTSD